MKALYHRHEPNPPNDGRHAVDDDDDAFRIPWPKRSIDSNRKGSPPVVNGNYLPMNGL